MKRLLTAICLLSVLPLLSAKESVDTLAFWQADGIATLSSGSFAPHYIAANRFGIISGGDNALLSVGLAKPLNSDLRFSYAFGTRLVGGYTSDVNYTRFDPETNSFVPNHLHSSRAFIQELYATAKWRSLFITAGMKEFEPVLVNRNLSSGDLIHSGNARPIPQVRAGFVDFQPVPFTSRILKIQGEIAYGKYADARWWEKHGDRYNSPTVSGIWYLYRRLLFRLEPSKVFSLTIGGQAASQFGGKTIYMKRGLVGKIDDRGIRFADFFKMIIPVDRSKEGFYQGNTLGSWDIRADFKLNNGTMISGYVQNPWEDGSGMAKQNGLDGLYGLELKLPGIKPGLEGAVIEYLDLTNQSGPVHFNPDDFSGTAMTSQATGADDYYNNKYYIAYTNYGMLSGNPMVMAPLYNLDGYNFITGTRMRGVHAAARGWLNKSIIWELKTGWRKAYGSGYLALVPPLESFSAFASLKWYVPQVRNLTLKGSLGLDRGHLPENSLGAEISVAYSGVILSKSKK